MPPRARFTGEEIIEAAVDLVAEKGLSALTARDLAAALGTSTRPIFTAFKGMDEVYANIKKAAMKRFDSYAKKAEGTFPAFKQVGMQMILFAAEQPELFRLLFMSKNDKAKNFEDIMTELGDAAELSISFIEKDYGLNYDDAMLLFRDCWIYTYGIGVMIATKVCSFTADEVSKMLTREFKALLMRIKGEGTDCFIQPIKDSIAKEFKN